MFIVRELVVPFKTHTHERTRYVICLFMKNALLILKGTTSSLQHKHKKLILNGDLCKYSIKHQHQTQKCN